MSDRNYHLRRDYKSCVRLNLQHLLNRHTVPDIIHPSVQLPSSAKIADVGTGTGAWLLDVARQQPRSVSLHGFDVDLRQCPNPNWLPENIKMHKWDVHDPVPEEAKGQYDLVHLRACIQLVRNRDPGPVIEQLKQLMKPGGYIQWLDLDVSSWRVVKAADDIETVHTEQLLERLKKAFLSYTGEFPGWFAQLPQTLEAHGFTEIRVEHFEDRQEDLASLHDLNLLSCEELSAFAPDREEFGRLIDRAAKEFEAGHRGVVIRNTPMMVVGRLN